MAYTNTSGTCCAPPADPLRNADGRLSFKCERPACHNLFEQSPRGRRRRFCSDRCSKAFARSRVTCPENAPKAPTADDPSEAHFRTKDRSEISGVQRAKNDLQKSSLYWVRVNEITSKLTDGKMSHTPASHGQWPGYYTERGIAWVSDRGWPFDRPAWYAY